MIFSLVAVDRVSCGAETRKPGFVFATFEVDGRFDIQRILQAGVDRNLSEIKKAAKPCRGVGIDEVMSALFLANSTVGNPPAVKMLENGREINVD